MAVASVCCCSGEQLPSYDKFLFHDKTCSALSVILVTYEQLALLFMSLKLINTLRSIIQRYHLRMAYPVADEDGHMATLSIAAALVFSLPFYLSVVANS